ncbi:MAG TPA: sugar ABC transporter substrate-binding protein [Clostridiales bacterium]|nr:sugar ABC transporter substrate-binding protein [Clostridiales bacterium]
MKKYFVFLLATLILAGALSGCSQPAAPSEPVAPAESAAPEEPAAPQEPAEEPAEEPLVIGQVFWGLHDSYQQAHQQQTAKYLEELGITYLPMDGQMKPEVQTAAMEDLIARGVDGIICQAYDQASMELSIKAAQEAGIPVVSFVNVSSGDVKYPSVEIAEEASAIEMGRIIGQKFKEIFPDKQVKLLTISDESVEWAHNQRTLAFVSGLKEVHPDLDYVFNGGQSNREVAYAVTEDVLQRDKDINLIFGYDAENGLGAIAALEAAGRGKADNYVALTEFVASVDGSTPEILEVMDPNCSYVATLGLRPKVNARSCVDLLLKLINGEMDMYETQQNIKVPSQIIDCWNMDIDSTQAYLKDEWEIDLDIRAELGL